MSKKWYVSFILVVSVLMIFGTSITRAPKQVSENDPFQSLSVQYGLRSWLVRLDQDEDALRRYLENIAKDIEKPVKDHGFDPYLQEPILGYSGRQVDIEEVLNLVGGRLSSFDLTTLTLPVKEIKPRQVELPDGAPYRLAGFSTEFDPNDSGRVHNIKLAAYKLHGQVIEANEEFSFNNMVGPTYSEWGFEKAPVIKAGEFVPDYGGGICQVSSTIYNAALLSGLQIVERKNHSRPVEYLPLGRDAAVYYDQLDLRLKNPHNFPIVLGVKVGENQITVDVFGTKPLEQRYEVVVKDTHIIHPQRVTETDPSLPVGSEKVIQKGRPGYQVAVDRVAFKDGERSYERIAEDIYPVVNEIVAKNP